MSTGGVAVLAVLVLALSAQAASATVYCVTTPAAPPGCTGTNEASLGDALTAADGDASGSDQIVLPVGTQTGPPTGYLYKGGAALTLSGQGLGSVLTLSSGSGAPVFSDAGSEPSVNVRSLTVTLPPGEVAGAIALGAPATVTDVEAKGGPGTAGYGIALSAGGLIDTDAIAINAGAVAVDPGVFVSGPAATTVRNSVLSDRTGLESLGPGDTVIHRSLLAGSGQDAALIADGSKISIDDSVLLASGGASGLEAYGGGAEIDGAQLTIVGDSSATGVVAETPGSGTGATVKLSDSVIADPLAHSFALFTASGADPARISTDYCDYDRNTILAGGSFVPGGHDVQPSKQNSSGYENPQFANPSALNYRLQPSSPLLNLDPRPLGATPVGSIESSTDLAGLPRITPAGRDLGAYQHQAATVSAKASTTRTKVGHPVAFSATANIAIPNDRLSYSWRFDDGGKASGAMVEHTFRKPGRHTATVTVTDQLGYSTSKTLSLSLIARPVISHLAVHRGAITFRLSETAKVHLMFTLRTPRGAQLHHTFTLSGKAGPNRFEFAAHKPPPGSYTVKLTGTAFGLKAKPRTLRFTV